MLFSHLSLRVQIGVFPSMFPTKYLYAPLLSPIRAISPTHLILLYFTMRRCTIHEADLCAVSSTTLLPCASWSLIVFSILFSNTLTLCSSLSVRNQVSHPYETTGRVLILYILILTVLESKREAIFTSSSVTLFYDCKLYF